MRSARARRAPGAGAGTLVVDAAITAILCATARAPASRVPAATRRARQRRRHRRTAPTGASSGSSASGGLRLKSESTSPGKVFFNGMRKATYHYSIAGTPAAGPQDPGRASPQRAGGEDLETRQRRAAHRAHDPLGGHQPARRRGPQGHVRVSGPHAGWRRRGTAAVTKGAARIPPLPAQVPGPRGASVLGRLRRRPAPHGAGRRRQVRVEGRRGPRRQGAVARLPGQRRGLLPGIDGKATGTTTSTCT